MSAELKLSWFAGQRLESPREQRRLTHPGLQQRNGRKTITTVQGIPDKFDARKLLKAMKKDFACNGHVVDSVDSDNEEDSPAPAKKDEHGQILQFQGDQRTAVKDFLLGNGIVASKDAKDVIVVCVQEQDRGRRSGPKSDHMGLHGLPPPLGLLIVSSLLPSTDTPHSHGY